MRFFLLAGLAAGGLFAQDQPAPAPDTATNEASKAAADRQEVTVKAPPLKVSTVFALRAKKCSIPLLIVRKGVWTGDEKMIIQVPAGSSGAAKVDHMPLLRGPAPSCDDK